jgi:hypothetical protein
MFCSGKILPRANVALDLFGRDGKVDLAITPEVTPKIGRLNQKRNSQNA